MGFKEVSYLEQEKRKYDTLNGVITSISTDDYHVYLVYQGVIVAALSQKGHFYSTTYQSVLNDDEVNLEMVGRLLKGRGIDGDRIFSKFDSYYTIQEELAKLIPTGKVIREILRKPENYVPLENYYVAKPVVPKEITDVHKSLRLTHVP